METLLDLLLPDFDQVCLTKSKTFGDGGRGIPERDIKNL